MLSRVLIHRPNFAIVISVVITLAGSVAAGDPGEPVSRHHTAAGDGLHYLPRRRRHDG
jgi:hypothetical protein